MTKITKKGKHNIEVEKCTNIEEEKADLKEFLV